jgi:hypothetical protein
MAVTDTAMTKCCCYFGRQFSANGASISRKLCFPVQLPLAFFFLRLFCRRKLHLLLLRLVQVCIVKRICGQVYIHFENGGIWCAYFHIIPDGFL